MKLNDLPKGQAWLIKVGASTPELVDIDWPALDYFQKGVNGYIERLSFSNMGEPLFAIFDEDGDSNGKPYNELASHIVNTQLVGDVFIINPSDLD